MHINNEKEALENDCIRMKAVKTFLENVLTEGRDCYRENPTPLFADGININTRKHLTWKFPGGRESVVSNLGSQQNLFRTLTAFTNVTGDSKYKDAAKAAIQYHFNYLQDKSGLLQLGGHRFIDLKTLEVDGAKEKSGMVHELKNHFHYYDLMFEVNKSGTEKYIEGVWNAHVYNWNTMEISRHGNYGLDKDKLWQGDFKEQKPLFEAAGLSFLNAGSDLIYSGAILYKYTGNQFPLTWSKRLAHQYVRSRNPKTNLGAYQFTQPIKREETEDFSDTNSKYGDRAKRQLGPEFGEIALEGNVLLTSHCQTVYYKNPLIELYIAKQIGNEGKEFIEWTLSGLKSYIKYGYISETNKFRPLFTDGTDLSDFEVKRDGYYGKKGTIFKQINADGRHMLCYARAYLVSQEEEFWSVLRNIALARGLGDLGLKPGEKVQVNLGTKEDDCRMIFALLELYDRYAEKDYLELAKVIGDNIVKNKFYKGYFTSSKESNFVSFDRAEPLALIAIQASIEGFFEKIPVFLDGEGFFHGDYEFEDGTVMSYRTGNLYD